MKSFVFLVEGYLDEIFLDGFIKKNFSKIQKPTFIRFEGKQDLLKNIKNKIQYWNKPESHFIILLDQDQEDCKELKAKILEICDTTRKKYSICIVCRELENWYLGDLESVGEIYQLPNLANEYKKAKFRNNINDNTLDNLDGYKVLTKIVPEYQKIDGSRKLGIKMSPEKNNSQSFQFFYKIIKKLEAV